MFWDKMTLRPMGMGGGGANMNIDAGVLQAAPKMRKPKLGLALGGGAARGWAHIGALQVLDEAGLKPDVIAGTSIGAVVGGCYAAGKLAELETWCRSITKRRLVGLMDFHIGGSGLIAGERLRRLLARELVDIAIEDLSVPFAAIATEIGSGHEIWLTRGRLVEAMRASYSLPGVFDPVKLGGRWLMDGALVNPVPVTAARALGAEVVVCVNLNADVGGRGTTIQTHSAEPEESFTPEIEVAPSGGWMSSLTGAARRMRSMIVRSDETLGPAAPGLAGVMMDAFNITQDRISRSRLAGDPPDAMIAPRVGRVALFDFHRATETIQAGRIAAERALDDIHDALAACLQPA